MVTSLSALDENRRLIAQTELVTHLAKQMTDVKEISREVYKALINLAESEEICESTRNQFMERDDSKETSARRRC